MVTCNTCQNVSSTHTLQESVAFISMYEEFFSGCHFNLKEAIEAHFQQQSDVVDLKCAGCGHEECTKTTSTVTPPDFLMVQLLRFDHMCKINSDCRPSPWVVIRSGKNVYHYQLVAVVEHVGSSVDHGHYIAQVLEDE